MKNILLTYFLLQLCTYCSAQKQADLLIKNVTIVQVDKGTLIPQQVVVIGNGRILETGPEAIAKNYTVAKTVDATSKFIIPGLWDMHIHFGGDTLVDDNEMLLPLYLAMGITTVRDAAGDISTDVLK